MLMMFEKQSDALFIKWGTFQAGAVGRIAIITLGVLSVIAVSLRWIAFW
jgi:hypothetical protein